MNPEPADRGAWIVLGGSHLHNQTGPRRPDDTIVLVQVPPEEASADPVTTVVVRWNELGPCAVRAMTAAGESVAPTRTIGGGDLFTHAVAGPDLDLMVGPAAAAGLMPLCYLAQHRDGFHVYAQIRFHPEDACFVRTTPEPVGGGDVEALRWLAPALDAHAASALRLNNHNRYYQTHFAGTELEHKFNLAPGTDIWATAMRLLRDLRGGALAGCRPEYRNELQAYFTENHLFDVTGPAQDDIGYASFIRTVDGRHVLKRKWYKEDSCARREELSDVLDLTPDGFEPYLRDTLGLTVQAMPPFRRVRYDVQCESMTTGHVYGIFVDHCSLIDVPEVVLSQCELEYRRTRGVLDHDEDQVLTEMERISNWLLDYLSGQGLTAERTYYSKRTFLQDVMSARRELTAAPQ